jgi:Ricin-type beta-trefoil lectin domain-like
MRQVWWRVWTLALLLLAGCGATLQTSSPNGARVQAVNWVSGSVREVYNPSGDIYTYAPSIIVDGNTEHIWSCHNRDSGVIKDYIYYTKRVNGSVVSSQPVLNASASGWDQVHVCDPSVLRSNVTYNGTSYSYVMFYLGNDQECSCHNQIGVAVAQNIAGPWTKYPNPIVTFPYTDTSLWGVGQPSATSVDGNGRFLLFYSQGDTIGRGFRRDINISNLNNPSIGNAVQVTDSGLYRGDGAQGQFTSFDVAYDGSRDRFYAVLEQYPFASTYPNYITTNLQLVSIEASSIWNGGGTWRYEGTITPALTGFPRNHNAGLKRTQYGALTSASALDAVFTKSCARENGDPCPKAEWSYDLWEIRSTLDNTAAQPPAASGLNGYYKIINRASGKALDVPYESYQTDGTQIQQYTYGGYQQQQWQISALGGGFYKVLNRLSGKSLDVPYESYQSDGAKIQQYGYGGYQQQQWQFQDLGGGYYKIINRLTSKVLDVPYEGLQNNGTKIQQWTDLGNQQQQWQLVSVP